MNEFETKVKQVKTKYKISDESWEDFFMDLGDLLALALKASRPYLVEIDHQVMDILSQEERARIELTINCAGHEVRDIRVSYDKKVDLKKDVV